MCDANGGRGFTFTVELFSTPSRTSCYPNANESHSALQYTAQARSGPLHQTGASTNTHSEHKTSLSSISLCHRRTIFNASLGLTGQRFHRTDRLRYRRSGAEACILPIYIIAVSRPLHVLVQGTGCHRPSAPGTIIIIMLFGI